MNPRKSKERSLLVGFILSVSFAVIIFRLLWIQTVQADTFLSEAQKEWISNDVLHAQRGTIYDRTHQQPLAWEVEAYRFVVSKQQIKDVKKMAHLLAPILQVDEQLLLSKLQQKKTDIELRFPGKVKFSQQAYNQVKALQNKGELKGLYIYPTQIRQYYNDEATHLLGYVNQDDQAVGGVESYYDQWLRGQDGMTKYMHAKKGYMISDDPMDYQAPVPGKDLVLTIDEPIQHLLYQELTKAVNTYQAKGAIGIVADPKTGEILGMVSLPTFDPNTYNTTINQDNLMNRAVSSQFEPGSTFKIVTLAAAIQEGVFHPQATFQSGSIKVADRTFRDWNPKGWGAITYEHGVELSSNVGFVKLGQQLGADRLETYIDRFGFGNVTERLGTRTGIDLPAEGRGYFFNGPLYPAELATTAFGQGISVTPIQQIAAVSAIANGGTWIQPHVMKELWDPAQDKMIQTFTPTKRQIIQASTAQEVRNLLRLVVKDGTGTEANIPGYGVAGKTGTAQKPDPNGHGYASGSYVVSFIGFAPYTNPNLVVYIAIDQPSSLYGGVSGGHIAAPIAGDVLANALRMRGIAPDPRLN